MKVAVLATLAPWPGRSPAQTRNDSKTYNPCHRRMREIRRKFGGARPIFTRCFRIFRIPSELIIMAMIFIGEPQGGQVS